MLQRSSASYKRWINLPSSLKHLLPALKALHTMKSACAALKSLAYHSHTIHLFIKSDIKTTIFPVVRIIFHTAVYMITKLI